MTHPGYPYTLTTLILFLLMFQTGCKPGDSGDSLVPDSSLEVIDSIPPGRERSVWRGADIQLKKELEYEQYTLDDEYPYKDTVRHFQWEKIREKIAQIENAVADGGNWGVLSNYKPKIPCFCNHIYRSLPDVLSLPLKVYGISRRSKTSR